MVGSPSSDRKRPRHGGTGDSPGPLTSGGLEAWPESSRKIHCERNRSYSAFAICASWRTLFHEAKSPACFHSFKSVDKLRSIKDANEPVQGIRSVSRAGRIVLFEDAPSVLDRLYYGLLIRVRHDTRL